MLFVELVVFASFIVSVVVVVAWHGNELSSSKKQKQSLIIMSKHDYAYEQRVKVTDGTSE